MSSVDITLDHLTAVQREVAEIIGLENYLKLVKRFGGSKGIYVPKYSELLRPSRDQEITEKFNGWNYEELGIEYDLSERTIRTIVAPMTERERSKPLDGQLSFQEIEVNS